MEAIYKGFEGPDEVVVPQRMNKDRNLRHFLRIHYESVRY